MKISQINYPQTQDKQAFGAYRVINDENGRAVHAIINQIFHYTNIMQMPKNQCLVFTEEDKIMGERLTGKIFPKFHHYLRGKARLLKLEDVVGKINSEIRDLITINEAEFREIEAICKSAASA